MDFLKLFCEYYLWVFIGCIRLVCGLDTNDNMIKLKLILGTLECF